jgi:hypothetical protein
MKKNKKRYRNRNGDRENRKRDMGMNRDGRTVKEIGTGPGTGIQERTG